MKRRLIGLILVLLAAASVATAAETAPPWLQQAASIQIPSYPKEVTAVVLVDDAIVTINDEGKVVKTYSFAVRILRREGREYAVGGVGYLPDIGKVNNFRAWLIRPGRDVKRYGDDAIVDVAGDINDVYNEYRLKKIFADDDADAGDVFGYSYTSEDRSIFSQDDWAFQSSIPVVKSRYTLTLPTGWRAESVTFNHPPIEPRVSGSTYSWELSNLPPLHDEPLSPRVSNLVARLAVSYYPPSSGSATRIKTFANWNEVAVWMAELEDPQVTVDAALTGKAQQLTANAKTEYEKIQAIGRYVQNIQYISIQTGIGRGGGYRPRSAVEVFAKSYGDCKDKANLMRAMLRVVGIDSIPVSIYSGDPTYVRNEWPSPQQFNHCIIAVKVSPETQAPTVFIHPRLGRLLAFDPTDSETPVGDLPYYLQDSLALVDSKESDGLVRMPVTPAEMNQLERNAALELMSDGTIQGSIKEVSRGQIAVRFRSEFRNLPRPQYNSSVEQRLSASARAARIAKLEPADDAANGRFSLDIEFTAPSYGQLMQDRLLVFKPAIVQRREDLALTAPERKYPVVLRSNSYSERVSVKLPYGFAVDELPEPVNLETPFGTYKTTYEEKGRELIFTRSLTQKAGTIPVEQYQTVRTFFEKVRNADQAPVVLVRK